MKRTVNRNFALAAAIAAVAAFSTPALADGNHGDGAGQGMMGGSQQQGMMGGGAGHGGQQGGMMGGMMGGGAGQEGQGGMMGNMAMMQNMMKMMMQMHGQSGGMGMGGMGGAGGMGYMSGLPGFAGGDPATLLSEFDADGNGSLSIAEFEALHAAAIRELMVDRFQALDNDGDGEVTAEELAAQANKMMQGGQQGMMGGESGQQGMMGMSGGESGAQNGMMGENGTMMQNQGQDN